MKSFWCRLGQLLAFMLSVRFTTQGAGAEGFGLQVLWFFLASLMVSAFVALVKLDIKKERNA